LWRWNGLSYVYLPETDEFIHGEIGGEQSHYELLEEDDELYERAMAEPVILGRAFYDATDNTTKHTYGIEKL
jgi:hypothetical protein